MTSVNAFATLLEEFSIFFADTIPQMHALYCATYVASLLHPSSS